MEIERTLPGGVRSRWKRDRSGRPLQHSIEGTISVLRDVTYQWDSNDRLRAVVDSVKGPTEYGHDALGNLTAARYPDGKVDLRMPDAVGNLFKTSQRTDREYGPAGQLLVARSPAGETRYRYDPEGNLIEKSEPSGRVWRYAWTSAGMMAKVVRPDGTEVTFAYDALGRRVRKTYRGQTTRWVWDGNTPLHEWVEGELQAEIAAGAAPIWSADAAIKKREAELQQHLSQGPPSRRGSKDAPITWLFEPDSFASAARIVGGDAQSIITDHLGTPVMMTDGAGKPVWRAEISVYGELRDVQGDRYACPFRWPGQYEDAETGLYYNRFRYYDPESGQYTSQDPIRLKGGARPYAYAADTLTRCDVLGLSSCNPKEQAHINDFREGAAVFLPADVYQWARGKFNALGRDDGLFVTRKSAADELQAMDKALIRHKLGIPDGAPGWDGPLVRLDIPDPLDRTPRMATGTESAANKLWKPGGYTSGGVQEIVTDPVPWSAIVVSGPF